MKIVLTNITSLRNKGCEALVKCAIRGLLDTYPDAEFTVFTHTPDYDEPFLREAFGSRVRSLLTPPILLSSRFWAKRAVTSAYPWARSLPLFPRPSSWEAGLRALGEADLVVSSGGDIFGSEYGDLQSHLRPLELAQRFGKPVVLLAHSIGPFKREEERQLFKRVASGVQLITVREPRSYAYVSELLGSRKSIVHLTADVAFNLEPSTGSTVENLCRLYGIPDHGRVLGLNLSQGIAMFSGTSSVDHYSVIRETAEQLIGEGFHLVLIPHVHERYVANDDRLLVSRLARELGYTSSLSPITGDHTAEELKAVIGRCSVLIAERTHAAIGGMSQGIPTLNIAYSVKAYGITDALFEDQADQFRIPVNEANKVELIKRVQYLYDNREAISQQMMDKLPQVKDAAAANFRLVKTLI